ncbi:MAG: hypothetical protein MZV70_37070 [Desulfobacterales bacterium]|nr:hypothetical protein [Desulfobacterales bacterium]
MPSCDQIQAMLDASEGTARLDEAKTRRSSLAFKALSPGRSGAPESRALRCRAHGAKSEACARTTEITLPHPLPPHTGTCSPTGPTPSSLLNELRGMGESTVVCTPGGSAGPRRPGPRAVLYQLGHHPDHHQPMHNAIRDVFIFVEDTSELSIQRAIDRCQQPSTTSPTSEGRRDPAWSSGDIARDDLRAGAC